MRVLILSSLCGQTGNNSTAQRIRQELQETDIKCDVAGISQFDEPESFSKYVAKQDIDCIIGVHAYRAGSLLLDSTVPYCIVFGGTDINQYHQNESYMMIMTKAVMNARYLVAFSEAMKSQVVQLWPYHREKILVQPQAFLVNPGEDEMQLLKCQDMILDSLQVDFGSFQNTIIFLLIAGLRHVKDPLFLAEAISGWHKKDSRIHLIIIGPELDKEFAAEVKARIQHLPGIALMPPVDSTDLQAIMRLSFAVVNSSISEGMATSLVESMAIGVPVLARNIPANAAIIKHGKTGFLFNSPEEFVSLAKELIQCKSKTCNVIRNAQEYVHKTHSYEDEKTTYVSIIEKMTSFK